MEGGTYAFPVIFLRFKVRSKQSCNLAVNLEQLALLETAILRGNLLFVV